MRAILLTAIIATAVVIASSILVDAKAPDGCYCMNGASRASTTYCSCTGCPSPFIGPFCAKRANTLATIAITFDNKTAKDHIFALDKAQDRLRKALSASSSDLSWMSRSPTYEQAGEVVVLFVINSDLFAKLYTDLHASPQPAYITQEPKILDAWQTGLKTAPASIFSQHIANSAVLGEHDLFSLGAASTTAVRLVITGAHLEFFIGALCVLVAAPLIDGLIARYLRPTDEQLDEEVRKHGGEGKVDELDRRKARLNLPPTQRLQSHTSSYEMMTSPPLKEAPQINDEAACAEGAPPELFHSPAPPLPAHTATAGSDSMHVPEGA